MERVLLLHLDGSLPNLALMRIAAHERDRGARVVLRRVKTVAGVQAQLGDPHWHRVYGSLIFEKTRPLAEAARRVYPHIVLGGTGWKVTSNLADAGIEDGWIDYSDYPNFKRSIGFAMRGCRLSCRFCVVPKKEGKARSSGTIAEIWRGDPYPREILLLDNDFFGNPSWKERHAELVQGDFKVSFVQGINARMLTDEACESLADLKLRDDGMKRRRLYTAWDGRKDEKRLFAGLHALVKHGFSPDMIMVYMLIGEDPTETHADRDYRRQRLRDFGCRPYPMPFTRTPELVAFQRWVVQRHDKHVPWEKWWKAKGEPRKLGKRSSSLALSEEPPPAPTPKTVNQCKSCPWKVNCDPVNDIPGYRPELARKLDCTIASGIESAEPVIFGGTMRMMACHYSKPGEEFACAGWLENQLGPGNNIGVRILVAQGKLPVPITEGEQHERYEDTLPCDAGDEGDWYEDPEED